LGDIDSMRLRRSLKPGGSSCGCTRLNEGDAYVQLPSFRWSGSSSVFLWNDQTQPQQ